MTAADARATAVPVISPLPAPATPAAPAVRFVGDRRAYWRLLVRGAALLAVTLGIYRFWFATDVRRFLWSNTEIANETLEYTGTPYELLIGFLIAIAVLVPIYVMFFIVALSLGPMGQLASVATFPILAFLGHFAVYRARRYRLTRTVYRGVRCHQGGSALRYAVYALFWWVLILLTLGLAYPFAQSRLERFKMRHTYYGNLQGRFEGSGFGLFLRGLPMWLLVVGPLAAALTFSIATVEWGKVAGAAAAAANASDFINQLETTFPNVYAAIIALSVATTASILMAVVLFPVFQAMMLRWWLSGLRFGALTVRSRLRTATIYGAYLRFLWYGFLFGLALSIAGGVLFTSLRVMLAAVTERAEITEALGAAFGVAAYVVMMLGYSTIYQGTVKLALWRGGVESVELENAAALDEVKAEGTPSSAVGEGLADALNVGGF
jgi:uncharacterized membrane protein YjgN (DUF898 family)